MPKKKSHKKTFPNCKLHPSRARMSHPGHVWVQWWAEPRIERSGEGRGSTRIVGIYGGSAVPRVKRQVAMGDAHIEGTGFFRLTFSRYDVASFNVAILLTRVIFRLWIATPNGTTQMSSSPSTELSSNSSDRELPRDMFRFKPSRFTLVESSSNSSYLSALNSCHAIRFVSIIIYCEY